MSPAGAVEYLRQTGTKASRAVNRSPTPPDEVNPALLEFREQ
jgi:hypothetical protein